MDFHRLYGAEDRLADSRPEPTAVPVSSLSEEQPLPVDSQPSNPSGAEEMHGHPHPHHHHRIELLPGHLVDVQQASHCLLQELRCDDWFVASRNEHQYVIRLLRRGLPHYAVSFQCTPCVDKAIYHGSRAWSVTIIPLQGEDDLLPETLKHVKTALTELTRVKAAL
jgi:hypothetical protein